MGGVPIRFYGDGTPLIALGKGWSKMVDAFNWTSCLCGRGSKLATEVVWLVGVLFICKGYLDFQAALFPRPKHNACQPCSGCPATQPDGALPYDNFQTVAGGAPWMALLYSVAHFMAADPFPHPFWQIPGVSGYSLNLDYMHVKHLGVDKYFLGSVLFLLAYRLLPKSPQENINDIYEFVEAFYKSGDVETRYTILKLTMFNTGPGGYPCLKGRAMEVRELMPAISALWRQGMTAGDVY